MKHLSAGSAVLFGLCAVVPGIAQAQGSGAAQEPVGAAVHEPGSAAVVASNVAVELTQSLSSKKAKVGDAVTVNTRSTVRISNGTMLPKGTKLMGKVTEVQARGGDQRDGNVAFLFDRAVLRDGQEVPIRASLRSLSAPAVVPLGVNADGMIAGGGDTGPRNGQGTGAGGGGGVGANGRSSGGALGGGLSGSGSPGGLSGVGPGARSGLGAARDVTGGAVGTENGADRSGVGLVDQTAGVSATATVGMVPVLNLPGVTAAASSSVTGVVHASGRNVELGSGTQMVLAVRAN